MTKVARLPMSFLTLSFLVLADTLLLQAFGTKDVAERFLAAADGLIPRPLSAILVVRRRGARRRHVERSEFGRAVVRRLILALALSTAGFALMLMERRTLDGRFYNKIQSFGMTRDEGGVDRVLKRCVGRHGSASDMNMK